ncbi:galactose-6-phosphate isomerase subunit LacA [Virgibacillus sp. MSJ-26]|uniref:galactose-6-phosphate isomerase subunit LacA n=1 Tax=Virgibacillus sp. MSJ-26 TaxID=2841522 RepID=UPI001C11BFD7|nr:galactose-6-phosphate isomerase subunit LacA [Virgibacillus sp. MSJ-26]MBU5465429.1 galactose-6-phosphate isomerase subunit LacA [Virgibacillus sp. MSJ-26]
MKLVIGSDAKGFELKEHLKSYLTDLGYSVQDETPEEDLDFYDATTRVVNVIQNEKADKGIVVDEYGAGPFMIANKHKGIICANTFDEHSAFMTRGHNNANVITIGSGIVGEKLAEKIAGTFVKAEYDGGRHQVRVDMLNKMC